MHSCKIGDSVCHISDSSKRGVIGHVDDFSPISDTQMIIAFLNNGLQDRIEYWKPCRILLTEKN